jgi:hypothetical protein
VPVGGRVAQRRRTRKAIVEATAALLADWSMRWSPAWPGRCRWAVG